jgi:integrase/recombinase XerD
MLEDYYVWPSTIDRVRASWLAPQIESYLEWLEAHRYSRLIVYRRLPRHGSLSLRDRGIFMVLYNTGARVQEIADLRIADADLEGPLRIRLHGKGDKWRSCPLWPETAGVLKRLTADVQESSTPLFMSRQRKPLTRFNVSRRETMDQNKPVPGEGIGCSLELYSLITF